MQYRQLGNTDLKVSRICLGTMTYGEQNTQEEGFEQMDYALDQGVNFFDTAEAYSIPMRPETQGSTETIIGNWFEQRGNRDKVILATKAAGPNANRLKHIRNNPNFSSEHLTQALHDSLRRLKTDYIDLYQLHWPERSANYFGVLDYQHRDDEVGTPFKDILETLQGFVQSGKIRYIGLSNETPWGVHSFLDVAKEYHLPRVMSIQNPYSLLNRSFEIGLAEMTIREKVGLLAYSPLAFGRLSGKYRNGQLPEGARLSIFEGYNRYSSKRALEAEERYCSLAEDHGLTPAQMSLAFVNSRSFLTSNIIGATKMEQLIENIGSDQIALSDELVEEINRIHLDIPNPAP